MEQTRREWTRAEEQWLIDNQQTMDIDDLYTSHIKIFGFERTPKALSRKREVGHLKKFRLFSSECGPYIETHYMTESDKDMSSALRITTKSVEQYRSDHKLFRRVVLTDEQREASRQRRLAVGREEGRETTRKLQEDKEYKGCHFCKITNPAVLDYHHLDPATKIFDIATYRRDTKKLWDEVDKCIVLCANCHRLVHAGQLTV